MTPEESRAYSLFLIQCDNGLNDFSNKRLFRSFHKMKGGHQMRNEAEVFFRNHKSDRQ